MPDMNPEKYGSPEDYLLDALEDFVDGERAKSMKHHRMRMRGEKPEEMGDMGGMKRGEPGECEACAKGECDDPTHLPDDEGMEE